jgi:hypothetical protein
MRLYAVDRLSEMGGRFYVHLRCKQCNHKACIKYLLSDDQTSSLFCRKCVEATQKSAGQNA